MLQEVIDKFGRYPQRNKSLGRENTPEEEEFLKNVPDRYKWWLMIDSKKTNKQTSKYTRKQMLLLWRIEYKNLRVISRGAAVSTLQWCIFRNLVNTWELYNITYLGPPLFWSNQILRFLLFLVRRIAKFWWHRILFCFSAKLLQTHKIKVFAKNTASYSETSTVWQQFLCPNPPTCCRWDGGGVAGGRDGWRFKLKGMLHETIGNDDF